MARTKQKWTSEEEEALAAGVEKYGQGKWKFILSDPQFASLLTHRSNVDLKDKWRNLSGSDYGSSSRGNGRTSVRKPEISDLLLLTSLEPSSTKSTVKRRSPPYKKLIYEALSSIGDPNGTNDGTVLKFLEPRYESCKIFPRSLTARHNELGEAKVLEKVSDRYKIKRASSGAETSQLEVCTDNVDNHNEEQGRSQNLIEEQVGPRNRNEEQVGLENCSEKQEETCPKEALEDAASVVAYLVSAADQEEQQLTKACEERDKVAEILQESMAMLRMAEDLYERCKRGEQIILLP